jgi:hypothetical protein
MSKSHSLSILFLCTFPSSLLFFIITYGIFSTPRSYAPTISVLLSDYIELSAVFGFCVAVYTVLETYVAVEYIDHTHKVSNIKNKTCLYSMTYCCFREREVREYWIGRLPMYARVFIALKNACFVMIPIIRVDEYPLLHYTFAGLTVFFAILMFIAFILRRKCEDVAAPSFILFNYIVLFLVIIIFLIFACGSFFNKSLAVNHDWAIFEYTLYFIIGSLNMFWVFDLDKQKCNC